MNVRVWAKYYGTEEVYVQNNSPYAIDLERLDHPGLGDQRVHDTGPRQVIAATVASEGSTWGT